MFKPMDCNNMKNISILGSGWLGLPLTLELSKRYHIKISTTTVSKIQRLKMENIIPYIVNIDDGISNDEFLDSDILIVNIPSKNIESFSRFVEKLKQSSIKKVIFISSTSVYKNTSKENALLEIESLFTDIKNIKTTILRFSGLIGYDRNLVKYFQTKIVPNSKSLVNMIHRDDCINIINQVIQKDIADEVFDCCASTHPTKEEFYTYCSEVSEYHLPQFDNKKGNDKVIDNQKLKDILAYEFIYDDLLSIKYQKELTDFNKPYKTNCQQH